MKPMTVLAAMAAGVALAVEQPKAVPIPKGALYSGGIVSEAAHGISASVVIPGEREVGLRLVAKLKGEVAVRQTSDGYEKEYSFELTSPKDQSVVGDVAIRQVVGPKKAVISAVATPAEPGKYAFHYSSENFYAGIIFRFDRVVGDTVTTYDREGRMRRNLMVPHEEFDPEKWDLNGGPFREMIFSDGEKDVRFKAGDDTALTLLRYSPRGLEASFRALIPNPRRVTRWTKPLRYSVTITEEYFCKVN